MRTGTTSFIMVAVFVSSVRPDYPSESLRRLPRRPYPDRLYFPDSFAQNRPTHRPEIQQDEITTNSLPSEIPLDLIMRLNEVQNVTELFHEFVKMKPSAHGLESDISIGNRFGDLERKSVTNPKPALCIPELKSVSLIPESSTDPTLFYYPTCTRVERCGGCCSHDLLGCQPTATETINFQVIVTQYGGASSLKYIGKEIVPIEQHLKCKCNCIIKSEDCNQFQEYRDRECRCACVNYDDEIKCSEESETKLWDARECTCKCRDVKECSTGFYHDEKTCSCLEVPITRRRVSERFGGGSDQRRHQIGRFDYKTVNPRTAQNSTTKSNTWYKIH